MRRTIADARRALEEEVAPRANEYGMRKARAVLEAAERHATEYATRVLDDTEPLLRETIDESSRELAEVRDALDDLRREAKDGRISASDYATRLSELRDRQTRAEVALSEAEDRIADVEKIEDDPIAYYDAQSERFRHLQRSFPW